MADPSASFCTMDGMAMDERPHHRLELKLEETHHRYGDTTIFLDGDDANLGHHHGHRRLSSSAPSMGTIMYMDGFHWALFPSRGSPPPPCLNLFYPSWTLHTRSRFIFAMASVTSMGILVEACGMWRARCLRKGRARRAAERAAVVALGSSSSSRRDPSHARRWDLLAALLHASRVWLGYLLMLAVMSYAVEFLLSVILGIVLGRYFLIEVDGRGEVGIANGGIGGTGHGDDGDVVDATVRGNDEETWGAGGDPCCDHDDDVDFREPLLSSSISLGNGGGVTRRSVV